MEIYFWRPRSIPGAALARVSRTYRSRFKPSPRGRINFGDELGPLITGRILSRYGVRLSDIESSKNLRGTFFSVGSVTHVARNGDTIWGSGALGGIKPALAKGVYDLNIYAVRGPLTREELIQKHQIKGVPEVFGDPALLFPDLFPEIEARRTEKEFLIINHMDDDKPLSLRDDCDYISANLDPIEMAKKISGAATVVTSSLHGKILSDAYGVPSIIFKGKKTKPFKYDDYSLATRGHAERIYPDIDSALKARPEAPPELEGLKDGLLRSFPIEVFLPKT